MLGESIRKRKKTKECFISCEREIKRKKKKKTNKQTKGNMAVHFDLVNKMTLAFLAVSIVYFIAMDILLYSRVKNYRVKETANDTPLYKPMIPCDLNPLCAVTVKGLTLDHPNHFLLSPLAALMDKILGISKSWNWLTPNLISGFHVFIAVLAGKCVSSESLSQRRLGVMLFQVRT